jgi:hypothetical protein
VERSREGVANDPDEGPSPLSYSWATTGGVIDDPYAAKTTLSSDTTGTFTVELTVSDGELSKTKSVSVEFLERPDEDAGGPEAPEHPNILFILADDLGAESTSVYPQLAGNNGQVPLPNLEALAAGLVFDNAWASPVCSPTRGTIISGTYGYRTGVTTVGNVLPTSTVTLFDRLTSDSPNYEQAFLASTTSAASIRNHRAWSRAQPRFCSTRVTSASRPSEASWVAESRATSIGPRTTSTRPT